MLLNKTLVSLGLLTALLACQEGQESTGGSEKSLVQVTFGGKTRIYNDASISEGKLGSISSIGITAGSTESGYLSLTAYGSQAGTYPYKQDINNYTQVSQAEYKTDGTVFNNYFTKICPDKSGYYSTTGALKILEYIPGKHAKGTFAGALINANGEEECNPDSTSFSGEFDITID
jgi:hypothetical protein